jgi:hypothetical protein
LLELSLEDSSLVAFVDNQCLLELSLEDSSLVAALLRIRCRRSSIDAADRPSTPPTIFVKKERRFIHRQRRCCAFVDNQCLLYPLLNCRWKTRLFGRSLM